MRYEVYVTQRAQRDLNESRDFCSLESNPQVHPVAPESKDLPFELRQFIHRTRSKRVNRALFVISGSQVRVLAVRRPGQQAVGPEDLE